MLVTLGAAVLAGAGMVGCASAAPYNPDRLGESDFARVEGICQNVMGLSPEERPTGGNWLGNDSLDYWTSHYNGCVLSLSDSLRAVQDTQATQQADEACRAKGLRPGTPDLALCVLQTANSHFAASSSNTATVMGISANLTASGSFYSAAPYETVSREAVACAALGLSPAQSAFKTCIKDLDDTFYTIDHPIN
jgi:hypothetical protein